jgi:sialic acid synthase SpsE
VVRQGYGLAPSELANVIGMKAVRDIPANMLVRREDLCV